MSGVPVLFILGFPYLANKNTKPSVKFKFQINLM